MSIDPKDNDKKVFLSSNEIVKFTYNMHTIRSKASFAARLDHYTKLDDALVHWELILVSMAIIIVLVAVLSKTLSTSVKRDIQKI